MKRFLIFVAGIVAALTIAACGTAAIGGSGSGGTVGTKQIDGFGNVLVDSSGMALYVNDQESGGKMLCDGSCTSIWQPLTVAKASAAEASGVDGLGVVSRSDGSKQVTLDGKPLYTFYLDRPGKVSGKRLRRLLRQSEVPLARRPPRQRGGLVRRRLVGRRLIRKRADRRWWLASLLSRDRWGTLSPPGTA